MSLGDLHSSVVQKEQADKIYFASWAFCNLCLEQIASTTSDVSRYSKPKHPGVFWIYIWNTTVTL